MGSLSTLQQPRLRDRYSIQQTLGARLGRRTLLAHDHRHRCPVVVKYLCFEDPLQPSDINRFRKEAAVLKTLDHPAIPHYLDDFEIDEHGYRGLMLVQAYIEGKSLYRLIEEQHLFSETEVRSLAHQILEILTYLHSQRPEIIHRDIKPSSLILTAADGSTPGKVYLVDFGLVQRHPQTQPDEPILISGTPGYRPPEQLGDRAKPATDLYSLGATLIHLATGKHPNSLPQRGLRILFGQELGHMGRPFKSWLRWLTQPKQHKRPASAQAALHGLEQADKIFTDPAKPGIKQRLQRALLQTLAPPDTELTIFEYSQTLEILLPPLGWKSRQFCFALAQIAVSTLAIGALLHSGLEYWGLSNIWQKLVLMFIIPGLTYVSLRWEYRGLKVMITSLFQQLSIQLLPDIILLGHRFPCRPVDYQVNTYKRDIEDIDLQPGSSTITFHLRRNRTVVGKLKYAISAQALGLKQSEITWIHSILQLWLKQGVYQGPV